MTRLLLAAASLLVLAATTTASAQPALTPLQVPAQPAAPIPSEPVGAKDPGVATLLSVAGTLVPSVVLMSAAATGSSGPDAVVAALIGAELGPSLGHWYAGDYLTAGLGMRVGGSALVLVGLSEAFDCLGSEDSSCRSSGGGPVLLGAALFATGSIYDIATAGRAARAWNTAHLQVAPTMISSAGRSSVGVGLGGTF